MTIIYEDGQPPRWVDIPRRKHRQPARALRFAGIQVGDQLINRRYPLYTPYFLVTDLWFDPVAGQNDPVAGQMVAIVPLSEAGTPLGRKRAHTRRGLASQEYRYADIDFVGIAWARHAAMAAGTVVGIGRGHAIRRRPKMPGPQGL